MQINKKPGTDFTRIFDLLTYQQEKYPNAKALNAFVNGGWKGYAIAEVINSVNALSCWLLAEGYKRGEKIILVPQAGNPEWMLIDFACQQIGLITVPVHPTSNDDEIEIVFTETEARLCIVADVELYNKFNNVNSRIATPARVFHLQQDAEYFFAAVNNKSLDENLLKEVEVLRNSISPDNIVTILYTSGSSGIPKGVSLTHGNIIHNIKAILMLPPLEPHHRVISFLPFSHILERVACYTYLAFGVSIYFSQRKENFERDFKTVRPYFCTCVPRVLEKMYNAIQEQVLHRNWIKRNIIRWALNAGKRFGTVGKLNIWFAVQLFFARLFVLHVWRKKLGGKIRYMVVGAASLQPEIGRLFSAAGITIVEGYGMTETAPLISVNRFEPGMSMFGTVGLPIAGIEVKIDEPDENHEGEILVRGPNVMHEYFKRPELTASVFSDDGWFRTGDVGKFVHQRFLKITDRKKDIFKTSSGKYISPLPLQNHVAKSPFIQQCLVLGFQRPFVTALIVPNFELLEKWCEQKGIHWTSPQFMVHNIKIREVVHHEIDRLNESLPGFQRIRDFVLCHQEWTVENRELTNTLKPIRKNLLEHYEKEVEKMYGINK
jgi:long-chain acyl-CoA synthetase